MTKQIFTEPASSIHLYRVLEDEYINLYGPLPAEYPWLFLQSHIKDRRGLIAKIKEAKTPLNLYLRTKLERLFLKQVQKTQSKIGEATADPKRLACLQEQLTHYQELQQFPDYGPSDPRGKDLADALVEIFNQILPDPDFYESNHPFLGVVIQEERKGLSKST